jgi:hypothetical protein
MYHLSAAETSKRKDFNSIQQARMMQMRRKQLSNTLEANPAREE